MPTVPQSVTACHLLCATTVFHWTRSRGGWRLICLDSNAHHPAPLRRFVTLAPSINVMTYLLDLSLARFLQVLGRFQCTPCWHSSYLCCVVDGHGTWSQNARQPSGSCCQAFCAHDWPFGIMVFFKVKLIVKPIRYVWHHWQKLASFWISSTACVTMAQNNSSVQPSFSSKTLRVVDSNIGPIIQV